MWTTTMSDQKFIIFIGIFILLDGIQASINDRLLPKPNQAGSSSTSFISELIRDKEADKINEAIKERGGLIWKRPDEIAKYPHTWHTFVKTRSTDGEKHKFEIKDIPENRYDEVVELIGLLALNFRPVYKALDIFSDPEAVKFLKNEWKMLLKQKMSVACFHEDTIVGINLLGVFRKNDFILRDTPNKNVNTLFRLDKLLASDKYRYYDVREYLFSDHLVVDPAYESFGITEELFKIAEKICWTFSIQLSVYRLQSPELDELARNENFILEKGLCHAGMRKVIPKIPFFDGFGYSMRVMHYKKRVYKPPKMK